MTQKMKITKSTTHGVKAEAPRVLLSEVAQIILGLSVGRLPEGPDKLVFVQVKHITDAGVLPLSEIDDIRESKLNPSWEKCRIQEGDVLVTAKGSVLRAGSVGPESAGGIASSNLIILRPDQNRLLPSVLTAVLQSSHIQNQLLGVSRSMVMQVAITTKDLGHLMIPLPPMQTQHRLHAIILEANHQLKVATQALEQRQVLVKNLLAQTIWGDLAPAGQGEVSR